MAEVVYPDCPCCNPCDCPVIACDHCETGLGAQILSAIFDDIFLWDNTVKMDVTITPLVEQSGFADEECEWVAPDSNVLGDNPPPGLGSRWSRFYFDSGSSTWRIEIDWMPIAGTYTPTNYLLVYELGTDYVCCSTSFTSTITRVSGPAGGLGITTEPTEVTISGCGCCGPVLCDDTGFPESGFVTIASTDYPDVDGLVISVTLSGGHLTGSVSVPGCSDCDLLTFDLYCLDGVLTGGPSFSGTSLCNMVGDPPEGCVPSAQIDDLSPFQASGVYCFPTVGAPECSPPGSLSWVLTP